MKAELLIHTTVYHQRPWQQPVGIVERFSRLTDSLDPPFVTPVFVATEKWAELPCGHVESIGQITIRTEKAVHNLIPTDEERELAEQKVLLISLNGPKGEGDLEILPGETHTFRPVKDAQGKIFVRARKGTSSFYLMITPR